MSTKTGPDHYDNTAQWFVLIASLSLGLGIFFILSEFEIAMASPVLRIVLALIVFFVFFFGLYNKAKKEFKWLQETFDQEPEVKADWFKLPDSKNS